MEYDKDKVDDTVLALLYLTTFEDYGIRAWKSMDWEPWTGCLKRGT